MRPLPVLRLRRDRKCTACPLHSTATNVCIPTIRLGPAKRKKALLILGEAPGYYEDQQDEPFVGDSGQWLREGYIKSLKADKYADVFIGNVVRCRPPQNETPRPKEISACSSYWIADVKTLLRMYESVTVLCAGAVASVAVSSYSSLTEALKHQGCSCEKFPKVRLFFTAHPAAVMREEGKLIGVREHLRMVREFLQFGKLKMKATMPVPLSAPAVRSEVVSADIETYGLFQNRRPQTCFHPQLMQRIDGVPIPKQIESLALAWPTTPGKCQTGYYLWERRQHRETAWAALMGAKRLDCMNGTFDFSCLRAVSPAFKRWMDRARPLIMDLSVTSFVENDLREERSLKALAPMFRVSQYGPKSEHMWPSPRSRGARDYNCQDAASTWHCNEEVLGRLKEAGRTVLWRWWSDVLHLCIRMGEAGVMLDREAFREVHDRELRKQARWAEKSKRKFGLPLEGTGSGLAANEMAASAAPLLPPDAAEDIKLTKKTGVVSTCDTNREIFLEHLPPTSREYRWWKLRDKFVRSRDLTSDVTGPTLTRHTDEQGRCHLIWRCVPTHLKDGIGKAGGQRQGRLSCRPGIITFRRDFLFPKMFSRFPGGSLYYIDLSQIELRIAALLSGDLLMLQEFENGADRHWDRAVELFGKDPVKWAMANLDALEGLKKRGVDITDPAKVRVELRQAGKHVNFLILYLGQGPKARETILKKVGIMVPMERCVRAVDGTYARYRTFVKWQRSLIEWVADYGWAEAPIPDFGIGLRRTWSQGPCEPYNMRDGAGRPIVSEIVNFPVQAAAAMTMLSAQIEMDKAIIKRRLRSVVCMNHYDACYIDVPRNETGIIESLLPAAFTRNWFIRRLERKLGRSVPILYDKKVKVRNGAHA